MTAAVCIASIALSYVLPGGAPLHPARAQFVRSGPVFAFDDGQRRETLERSEMTMWEKLENSDLSYKEVSIPGVDTATTPMAGEIVAVHFTASFVTSGEVIDSTGDKPLAFRLGDGSEPLFQEAVTGMKIGGKRRINLAPGSKYASPSVEDTIQFEIELVGIQTGVDALIYDALRNRSSIINTAILLSFAPDILGFLGLLPAPNGAEQLNAAFNTGGFGAVDILGGAVANAAANAPVVVDAANQWAAQGLQSLF